MLQLLLATFFLGNSIQTCWAQGEVESAADALKTGIDEISSILRSYEDRCSPVNLHEDLKKSIVAEKTSIKEEWERIETVRGNIQAACNKTKDMLTLNYQVIPTSPPEECASPFERVAGGCFWVHKNPTRTWHDARKFCQYMGGDLATPDDLEAMVDFARKELGRGWSYIFFGGQILDGVWKWATTLEPMDVTNSSLFLSSSKFRSRGNCGAFNGNKRFRIQWYDCDYERYFICEKKLSSSD